MTEDSDVDESAQQVSLSWQDAKEPEIYLRADVATARKRGKGFDLLFGSSHALTGEVQQVACVTYTDGLDRFRERNEDFKHSLEAAVEDFGFDVEESRTDLSNVSKSEVKSERFFAGIERASYHGGDAEIRFAIISSDRLQDVEDLDDLSDVIRPVLTVGLPTRLLTSLMDEVFQL